VAFPDDESPLQLLLDNKPQQSITLWNVAKKVAVAEIPLTKSGIVFRGAMSSDARFVALEVIPTQGNEKKETNPVTVLFTVERNHPVQLRRSVSGPKPQPRWLSRLMENCWELDLLTEK